MTAIPVTGSGRRRSTAGVAIRCLGVACLLALVVASGGLGLPFGVSAVLGGGLLLLTFDTRNPLSLRNFFVVYVVGLFALGGTLFGLGGTGLVRDMVLYTGLFLAGYHASALKHRSPVGPVDTRTGTASPDRVRVVEEFMLVLAGFQIVLLGLRISAYGLGAFYSGQSLIDQLSRYGQASVSGGVTQILSFVLTYSSIATAVIYTQVCLQARVKMRYRYLVLLFVVLPILSLSRSEALIGACFLLAINGVERRVRARLESEHKGGREVVEEPSEGRPPRRVFLLAVMMIAFLAAVAIGGLRQRGPGQEPASPIGRSAPLVRSEFTPILAYSEIKANEAVLGRQYGSTIFWPFILKVVPRGLFPGKPVNSGAYYMSVVRPAELAAGLALPPTLFGDAYLNFGMSGVLVSCLLLGMIAARLDFAYKEARLWQVPWFLFAFVNFYGVLRNAISETLSGIIFTLVAWWLLRHLLRVPRLPRETPVGSALATRE